MIFQPTSHLICFVYFLCLSLSDLSVAVLGLFIFTKLLDHLLACLSLMLRSSNLVQVFNIVTEDIQVRRIELELIDVHKLDLLSQFLFRYNFDFFPALQFFLLHLFDLFCQLFLLYHLLMSEPICLNSLLLFLFFFLFHN